MKGIRNRVVVALAGSTLLASGLSVAATIGSAGPAMATTAGGQVAHPPCSNATLIEYCVRG
jgi:hypothetical protein